MSGFNNNPIIKITNDNSSVFSGWNAILDELNRKISQSGRKKTVVIIETYQGAFEQLIADECAALKPHMTIFSSEAMKPESEILRMTYLDVTDDRIFGYMSRLNVVDFFDKKLLSRAELEASYQKEWNKAFKNRLKVGHVVANLFNSKTLTHLSLMGLRMMPFLMPLIIRQTHGKPMIIK